MPDLVLQAAIRYCFAPSVESSSPFYTPLSWRTAAQLGLHAAARDCSALQAQPRSARRYRNAPPSSSLCTPRVVRGVLLRHRVVRGVLLRHRIVRGTPPRYRVVRGALLRPRVFRGVLLVGREALGSTIARPQETLEHPDNPTVPKKTLMGETEFLRVLAAASARTERSIENS